MFHYIDYKIIIISLFIYRNSTCMQSNQTDLFAIPVLQNGQTKAQADQKINPVLKNNNNSK